MTRVELGPLMLLDEYQRRICVTVRHDELMHLLGIGAHAGALLKAHQHYLVNHLDAKTSRTQVRRELGRLLAEVATLAGGSGLSLEAIARANLRKIRERARSLSIAQPSIPADPLDGNTYQKLAAITDQQVEDGVDPMSLSVPMLGLAGEAGTLLVAQKKAYRDNDPEAHNPQFLTIELGDIMWYAAAVATHAEFDLEDAMIEGLNLVERHAEESTKLAHLPHDLPILDRDFDLTERFPRLIIIRFRELGKEGEVPRVKLTVEFAKPFAFPQGPIPVPGSSKFQGFDMPGEFGNSLNDNSNRHDAYRFHDAIHFGFTAVMGWSPNTRSLLGLKRRSDSTINENEDGARAIFAEEGMAAVLAKLSPNRQGYRVEDAVDDDTIDMLVTVFEDLEVARMPRWLWRRAVSQGFEVMRQLKNGRGGYVCVDLDRRQLTYSRIKPANC